MMPGLAKSRAGLLFASALAMAGAGLGSAVQAVRNVGSRAATRKRNVKRLAARRAQGFWGDMIGYDGIWHMQSDKTDNLPRGYPGAKMARKAKQHRLGLTRGRVAST